MHINYVYVLLFVGAGYFQKIYLKSFTRFNQAWKTFLLGTLCSLTYALLLKNPSSKETWVEFAASYAFTTSMYEMWIKDLANWILNKAMSIFKKKLDVPE